MSSPSRTQNWNAADYAANGRFVATLASAAVSLLNAQPGERILDAGCGDGALTAQVAGSMASIIGVDQSEQMLAAARARGLKADLHDLTELPYREEFDAVFSNAALHWITRERQPALLAGLHRALKPGGRLVVEMGGQGNIAAIRTALSATFTPHGLSSESLAASFFPSSAHYSQLLQQAGFEVHQIDLIPRPTPLLHGAQGMRLWLQTFRSTVLEHLPEPVRAQVLDQTVALLMPILHDPITGSWTADYVRLRFAASRPMQSPSAPPGVK